MAQSTMPVPQDYRDVIAKVAAVKDLDVEKFRQLLQLQEDYEKRQAATHYNEMMSQAQAGMTGISKDSANPVTRSRYASLAALDEVIRPIYTRHGFSIEFNDETPPDRPDWLKLVAYVSCGAETRHREKWIPVSTTGIAGRQAMTPTHASIAAVTYGRRALLKMIFNLAEEDDDGNLAGGRVQRSDPFPASPPPAEPSPSVGEIMKSMERCADERSLRNYVDGLAGRVSLTPADRDKVNLRYKEMLTGFRKPKEPEAKPAEPAAEAAAEP